MKTVIYITDNKLEEKIDILCRKNILDSIGDLPLISVSQKPIDFGDNICVGELPRSSLSINIQMMEALKVVKTKYIAIAEHDCLYTPEHFAFIPPNDNFWYNDNVWVVQYYSEHSPENNGTFSFFKNRKANSQLTCNTEQMIKATQDRIDIMSEPVWMKRYPTGRIGEVGDMKHDHAMRLLRFNDIKHMRGVLEKYIDDYQGENWESKIPNVDIRHKDNFTKNRRGSKRRFELPPWGTLEDVLSL